MITALLAASAVWCASAQAAPEPADQKTASAAILASVEQELERALTLQLPDQPRPWYVRYSVIDGEVATAGSNLGQPSFSSTAPYRQARVEVRVGTRELDNANFEGSYGSRSSVQARELPHEPDVVAFRRELWLATDEAYKGAAEQYSAKMAARDGRTPDKEPLPSMYPEPPRTGDPIPYTPVDSERLNAQVFAATAPFSTLPWVEEASAIGRVWTGRRLFVDSDGMRVWTPTGMSVIRLEAVTQAPDGARLRDARWWIGRSPDALPDEAQIRREAAEMADWLARLRDADVERDYLGPVLFEAPAAMELFRQLLPPELSGTPPSEQAPEPFMADEGSPPTARIGRRLLPEGWTLVDDPSGPMSCAGSYTLDHEGVEPKAVEAIQDGVLRDVLMSRSPRAGQTGSTGHGRGLGTDPRVAVPAVTTVTPKKSASEAKMRRKAMVLARQAGLDYVLVVRRLEPPAIAEDFQIAFTGDAPLAGLTRPLEVYRMYADGREEPVRGLRFVGVDRRVMRDIAMAGAVAKPINVLDTGPGPGRFSLGSVGGLPACWATPPVLITELELRGSGGQQTHLIPPP